VNNPTPRPVSGDNPERAAEGQPEATTGRPSPHAALDDDGTLDDFWATNVQSVHFEAIDQAAWYAIVHLDDGQVWQLDFGAVNRRAKGYAQAERVR